MSNNSELPVLCLRRERPFQPGGSGWRRISPRGDSSGPSGSIVRFYVFLEAVQNSHDFFIIFVFSLELQEFLIRTGAGLVDPPGKKLGSLGIVRFFSSKVIT